MKKIITWVDLQGRYRVTSPAYGDLLRSRDFNEDDAINWTWACVVECGKYGITEDHPLFLVEDADQRARLTECCGTLFRYGAIMRPNYEGRLDAYGKIELRRDARDGAWEMDVDGRPKVNLAKARGIQMDRIRLVRDAVLERESGSRFRQPPEIETLFNTDRKARLRELRDIPQSFDLAPYTTPLELSLAWPPNLELR